MRKKTDHHSFARPTGHYKVQSTCEFHGTSRATLIHVFHRERQTGTDSSPPVEWILPVAAWRQGRPDTGLSTLAASTTLPMLPASVLTGNSGCQRTALLLYRFRIARVITVLFWLLIITAERDGYIQFATVITRAILKELAR